jgi:hypothetical protein
LNALADGKEKLPADFCRELFLYIDTFLSSISQQSLVDSNQVQDFCLDLRFVVKDYENEDDTNAQYVKY